MNPRIVQLPRASVSPANRIFVLDCLRPGDRKTATDRHEQMLNFVRLRDLSAFDSNQTVVLKHDCADVPMLVDCLERIRDDCQKGVKPLLIVEGHGHPAQGLQLPSGRFLGWQAYAERLGAITAESCGELTVLSAFCHSVEMIGSIASDRPPPFSFHFGYEGEPSSEIVAADGRLICESALADGGRELFGARLNAKCYSEYDHAERFVLPALVLLLEPELAHKKQDLRETAERSFAGEGVPHAEITEWIKRALEDGMLIRELLCKYMHPTQRRERYWNALLPLIQNAGST